jgi:Flp pilus assembly protein TadG
MLRNKRQSGQALVLATFGLLVLLAAAGLSVDIGYLRYQRRLQQSAADSAALAGAAALGTAGNYSTAAFDDAQLNGFTDGVNHVTVTPTQKTVNGNVNSVQVEVSAIHPTFFMKIFGGSMANATVATTATASYTGARNCIYALAGGGGIDVTGNVDVPNCGVIDDENLTGRGRITASSIGVHGTSRAGTNPTAITGILQAADPFANLPDPGGAGGPNFQIITTNPAYKHGATVPPGIYSSISVAANYDQTVTFTGGTYVITGAGGLSLQGKGAVTGTNVTFYLGGAAGSVNIAASQTVDLTAPTNGTYMGILFFQNAANGNTATINGANGSRLTGAFYFPGATLTMDGAGNGGAAYMIFVAKTLNLATNIDFNSNYRSLATGSSPIKGAILVE